MPEGPEVEVIRRGLLEIIGSKILEIKISTNEKYYTQRDKFQQLKGYTIDSIDRKGKYLIWKFNKGSTNLIGLNHLGMTGIWSLFSDTTWQTFSDPFHHFKHFKLYFKQNNDLHLLFIDVRIFGKFQFLKPEEIDNLPVLMKMGPDILEQPFKIAEFIKRTRGKNNLRKKQIGQILLDSNIVAGCGNIYKSEALHRAKIHPMTPTSKLSDEQIQVLGHCLSEVAQEALKNKGSSLKDFQNVNGYQGLMQNKFKVYGLKNDNCQQCDKGIIISGKQGSRTSFWCPICQQLTPN